MAGAPRQQRVGIGPVLLLLAVLAFAGIVYAVVQTAGGTDVSPTYSNTPNGTVPGPPR